MTTFTINEQNEIVAFATPQEAAATPAPFESFTSEEDLAQLAACWPAERPVAIWNSLAGVTPVKKFKDGKAAASKIWPRIERLGEGAEPHAKQQVESKAQRNPKGGVQGAKGAPAKGKSSKKATPPKKSPKGAKATKPAKPESDAPREGSKTAQVVAMLQRKNGATLSEIMEKMGWQRHTVRGFMAGTMKKAGYEVESFKPESGERTYRIK
jgi:hypothetical protein